MHTRRCAPPLFAALLLFATPAFAQVSDADRATARALAQQCQEALDVKGWATAAEPFGTADAPVHAPTLMPGLARAEVGQGRWGAAMEHLSQISREGVPAGSPTTWVEALQDAQKELAALESRVPTAVITVSGPGARVTIDGTVVPAAALGMSRPVDPGKHTLHAEAEGFARVDVVLTFAERKVEKVNLQVDQPKAAAPTGSPPPPPPKAGGSPPKTIGFAGIGVGGAALIMGAVAGGLALSKHGDLANRYNNGQRSGQQSGIDGYNLMGNLSAAGFVVGGIPAATGVVLVAPKVAPAGETGVAGVVGPGFADLRGRF